MIRRPLCWSLAAALVPVSVVAGAPVEGHCTYEGRTLVLVDGMAYRTKPGAAEIVIALGSTRFDRARPLAAQDPEEDQRLQSREAGTGLVQIILERDDVLAVHVQLADGSAISLAGPDGLKLTRNDATRVAGAFAIANEALNLTCDLHFDAGPVLDPHP